MEVLFSYVNENEFCIFLRVVQHFFVAGNGGFNLIQKKECYVYYLSYSECISRF